MAAHNGLRLKRLEIGNDFMTFSIEASATPTICSSIVNGAWMC